MKIGFTGWNTKGERFEGTIEITVEEPAGASEIVYTTLGRRCPSEARTFVPPGAARGEGELRGVRLPPCPPGARGGCTTTTGISAKRGPKCAPVPSTPPGTGSPNLSDLTFLPKAGFTGSVQIGYEGTDSRGKTFRGQIRIQVNQGSGSRYFQDMAAMPGCALCGPAV